MVSPSSSQTIRIRSSISDTKFPKVRRSRRRRHHRSSTSSTSKGNDISFSSTHDSDEDEDSASWNSEQHAGPSPELTYPHLLRLRPTFRGLSDPPPVRQDSSTFSPPSPSASEDGPLLIYSSLPATPMRSPSPPASNEEQYKLPPEPSDVYTAPFSLWDYLREELLATDFDSHQELKWERVGNFLSIPLAIEKVSLFGALCRVPPNRLKRSYLSALYYALTHSCTHLQCSLFDSLLLSGVS
jgi:hypothetical protein